MLRRLTAYLLVLASLFVTSTTYANNTKPKHIGANWDNSKSYVERGERHYLKNKQQASKYTAKGLATWYCCYRKGTKTADGTLYGKDKLTAAHRTLPFGTLVKVTNTKTNKHVVVEITDRGPFIKNKIIDLTPGAFSKIEAKSKGIAQVHLEVVGFKY